MDHLEHEIQAEVELADARNRVTLELVNEMIRSASVIVHAYNETADRIAASDLPIADLPHQAREEIAARRMSHREEG